MALPAGGLPIVIPKVYSGKNRTCWHSTWKANKFGDPNAGGSINPAVPSAEWRNGDLPGLLKLGANCQLHDSMTIAVAPCVRFSRQALFIGASSTIAPDSDKHNSDRWFNTDVFNRKSAQQLASNIRTAPLGYPTIRVDSQRRPDLSGNKTFSITEQAKMMFRADTLNARNEVALRAQHGSGELCDWARDGAGAAAFVAVLAHAEVLTYGCRAIPAVESEPCTCRAWLFFSWRGRRRSGGFGRRERRRPRRIDWRLREAGWS